MEGESIRYAWEREPPNQYIKKAHLLMRGFQVKKKKKSRSIAREKTRKREGEKRKS